MTTGTAFLLLGFGLGALITLGRSGAPQDPRGAPLLREHVLKAQRISALAAQHARELTALWHGQEADEHAHREVPAGHNEEGCP